MEGQDVIYIAYVSRNGTVTVYGSVEVIFTHEAQYDSKSQGTTGTHGYAHPLFQGVGAQEKIIMMGLMIGRLLLMCGG